MLSSDCATQGLVFKESFAKSPMTFAAQALACETVSGMSFGPWHTPARYTPAVGLSTGFSFGCASVRKLLVSMLAVSSVAIFLTLGSGSMAVARTTRSLAMVTCSFSIRLLPCTISLPFSL